VSREAKMLQATSVTFEIPSKADVGSSVDWRVVAQIIRAVNWPELCVAMWYVDGPEDRVSVTMDSNRYEVQKGFTTWPVCVRPAIVGATSESKGKVRLNKKGTYMFRGIAGYLQDSYYYYYDPASAVEKTVEVSEPKTETEVPGVGKVEIPWIPIAIAGAVVAIIAVVGIVAYREMKREEMLMLMLLR
jgi:hypothetical protein